MSSKDFLKRMKEQAEEAGYSGGGGGTVAKILIELGLHRYVKDHDFWTFFKPLGDGDNEMSRVGEELSARLQKAGCNDNPVFGIKITIKKDVIGRDAFKKDLEEFIPSWQEDAFGLVFDAVETLDLPFNEIFYGRFQYKSNPFHVRKGEAGKTEIDQKGKARFPSIRLPVEKFASEAEAQAATGGSSSASTGSQWSDALRRNYPDLDTFDLNIANIKIGWDKIIKGELPWKDAPALPQPSTTPNLKWYLAGLFDCTSDDIDIVINMTPF